jgi:hypothetical protein
VLTSVGFPAIIFSGTPNLWKLYSTVDSRLFAAVGLQCCDGIQACVVRVCARARVCVCVCAAAAARGGGEERRVDSHRAMQLVHTC